MMNTQKTIGRYEILEELGRGAMGSVYKAHDPVVGRTVALKTILSVVLGGAQSEDYRRRFLREARAAGSLAHPGIVPVFDAGEHEGVPFLVMEFVDGPTLNDGMKSGRRFTLDETCDIGWQIAEALGYAHRQGVVHRDVKPANILMTSRAVYGAERARITDFGIAKLTTTEATATGQMLGTPAFMAPEQFTGAAIDGRADLFSLGVILYCLATGEQPFPGETLTSVSYKVVHTLPAPPSKLNPAIPARLEGVILKCLAKNPAERYQTGEELAQDLSAVRAGSAAKAMQATPPARAVVLRSEDTLVPGGRSGQTDGGRGAAESPAAAGGSVAGGLSQGAKAAAKFAAMTRGKRFWIALAGGAAVLVLAGVMLVWFGSRRGGGGSGVGVKGAGGAAALPGEASAATAKPSPDGAPVASTGNSSAKNAAAGKASPYISETTSKTALAFNPRALDAKTNGKLRVELKHVPDGLAFTIEMNGRPYLHAVAGQKASLKNLFVPPGNQEFNVVYQSGGREKFSNTVSKEFKARKRHTLRIELLSRSLSPRVDRGALSGDGELLLSLK